MMNGSRIPLSYGAAAPSNTGSHMPDNRIFRGCIPALMTPCSRDGVPNFDALVKTAQSLIADGMRAVVYCGSMGDWPLLTNEQRQQGVRRLVEAGIPVVVGTGAQNTH